MIKLLKQNMGGENLLVILEGDKESLTYEYYAFYNWKATDRRKPLDLGNPNKLIFFETTRERLLSALTKRNINILAATYKGRNALPDAQHLAALAFEAMQEIQIVRPTAQFAEEKEEKAPY